MHNYDSLLPWGWTEVLNNLWTQIGETGQKREHELPGRIIRQDRERYTCVIPVPGNSSDSICGGTATAPAVLEGKVLFSRSEKTDFPGVGDWVKVLPQPGGLSLITGLLPRKTSLIRHNPGRESVGQVMAANIDTVFIVMALGGGRNLLVPLLERCLAAVYDSQAAPVVLINKCDQADEEERERAVLSAENACIDVPVHLVSAKTGEGLSGVKSYLDGYSTVCFLGKSGVGKTALMNALALEYGQSPLAAEGDLSNKDCKGRHTTTHRELRKLPNGSMIIDMPGIKELGLWPQEKGLDDVFGDIQSLSEGCRFRDCSHTGEPGCAVQEALVLGTLDPKRYENYLDLQREIRYLSRRQDQRINREEIRKWKLISKEIRNYNKREY